MKPVLNVFDLGKPGQKFVDLPEGFQRVDFSGAPANWLEQLVRRPRLSRYRAALSAARHATGARVISHLPRMTAAVADGLSLFGRKSPHLAFSFNFTEIPTGLDLWRLKHSFRTVDRFCVFSSFEQDRYSELFGIGLSRFSRLLWAQDAPTLAASSLPNLPSTYVSAVGGEGRDYSSLAKVARLLPDIPFVVIARPYNELAERPSNLRLLHNIPAELTWRIACDSACMIVPLRDERTACGHITLVGGHLLGIPMISSRSHATTEYTENVSLYEPGDVDSLASLTRAHVDCAHDLREQAQARIPAETMKYSRSAWQAEVTRFLTD